MRLASFTKTMCALVVIAAACLGCRPKVQTSRALDDAMPPEAMSSVAPSSGEALPVPGPFCGYDVTGRLTSTINEVIDSFARKSAVERLECRNIMKQITNWDIKGMMFLGSPVGVDCGRGSGAECVEVAGRKFWLWDVNYVLWGLATGLCASGIDAFVDVDIMKVAAYKTAAGKANEFSPDLRAWYDLGRELAGRGKMIDEDELRRLVVERISESARYTAVPVCPVTFDIGTYRRPMDWATWFATRKTYIAALGSDPFVAADFNAKVCSQAMTDWQRTLLKRSELRPGADCLQKTSILVAQLEAHWFAMKDNCPPPPKPSDRGFVEDLALNWGFGLVSEREELIRQQCTAE